MNAYSCISLSLLTVLFNGVRVLLHIWIPYSIITVQTKGSPRIDMVLFILRF